MSSWDPEQYPAQGDGQLESVQPCIVNALFPSALRQRPLERHRSDCHGHEVDDELVIHSRDFKLKMNMVETQDCLKDDSMSKLCNCKKMITHPIATRRDIEVGIAGNAL